MIKTLKSKFIFWICLLFVLMGILIFVPLSVILPEKITFQILKRDIRIAQYLSREVQGPLLTNNKLALRLLLEDRLENLPDSEYIFIRGNNQEIISSTFKKGFPKGLLNINNPGRDSYSIEKFLTDGKKVYDIAIPLLKGELGSLHLGVSLESSKNEINEFTKINYYLALVIFTGLGIGILIFTLLGIFLSSRIIKLKDFAVEVGNGNLNETIDIKAKDEIGGLADAFNKMVRDLKENIEKIKRLSYLEERSRIAIEFHDGLAQDLADIIKRLELCEKLLKIDLPRALKELEMLKENTSDVLDKTRQAIFDFKLREDSDFNLLNSLNEYIKNYRKQNEINIKLDVSGPLENIPLDKSRPIFYIITEAFNNVKKHAQAKNIELLLGLKDNNVLDIHIRDDGKGFDINAAELSALGLGKWGLIGMRQRATSLGGRLAINSKLEEGTEVSVNIPLKKEKG